MGELIVGGLLVVLGFVGGRLEAWLERRRARKTIATALLAELRSLEGILNQVMEHGSTMSYDALEHPTLLHALDNMSLLEPDTAQRLSHFHNLLRNCRDALNDYRQATGAQREERAKRRRFYQNRAWYAANAIAGLVERLQREGGEMPTPFNDPPLSSAEPLVPPQRAFPKHRSDRQAIDPEGNS
jgi:uncharacterized membrane protein YccC